MKADAPDQPTRVQQERISDLANTPLAVRGANSMTFPLHLVTAIVAIRDREKRIATRE
jgi:hypothetical protein